MKRWIVAALALLLCCLVYAAAEPNADRSQEYTCGDYKYFPVLQSVQSTVVDQNGAIVTVTTDEVVGAMISDYDGSDVSLFIPAELDGISVTAIGQAAFSSCASLKSIVLPESVTKIGDDAFAACTDLTSVSIPQGVTKIGFCAFEYCPDLTIHAPKGSKAQKYAKKNKIPFKAK